MIVASVILPSSAIDQRTVPEELPVSGDPYNETMLELIFPGRAPLFRLEGKKLRLLEPLDRDDENLSHVVFQVRDLETFKEIITSDYYATINSSLYIVTLHRYIRVDDLTESVKVRLSVVAKVNVNDVCQFLYAFPKNVVILSKRSIRSLFVQIIPPYGGYSLEGSVQIQFLRTLVHISYTSRTCVYIDA